MTKRRLTVLAVAGLSVAALAGCGSKAAPAGSPGATQAPTTVAPPAATSGGGGGYGY